MGWGVARHERDVLRRHDDTNRAGRRPANGKTNGAIQIGTGTREAGPVERIVDLLGACFERGLRGPRQVRRRRHVDRHPQDEQDRQGDRTAPGDEAPADSPQQANVACRDGLVRGNCQEERSKPQPAQRRASSRCPLLRSELVARSGARSRYPTPRSVLTRALPAGPSFSRNRCTYASTVFGVTATP